MFGGMAMRGYRPQNYHQYMDPKLKLATSPLHSKYRSPYSPGKDLHPPQATPLVDKRTRELPLAASTIQAQARPRHQESAYSAGDLPLAKTQDREGPSLRHFESVISELRAELQRKEEACVSVQLKANELQEQIRRMTHLYRSVSVSHENCSKETASLNTTIKSLRVDNERLASEADLLRMQHAECQAEGMLYARNLELMTAEYLKKSRVKDALVEISALSLSVDPLPSPALDFASLFSLSLAGFHSWASDNSSLDSLVIDLHHKEADDTRAQLDPQRKILQFKPSHITREYSHLTAVNNLLLSVEATFTPKKSSLSQVSSTDSGSLKAQASLSPGKVALKEPEQAKAKERPRKLEHFSLQVLPSLAPRFQFEMQTQPLVEKILQIRQNYSQTQFQQVQISPLFRTQCLAKQAEISVLPAANRIKSKADVCKQASVLYQINFHSRTVQPPVPLTDESEAQTIDTPLMQSFSSQTELRPKNIQSKSNVVTQQVRAIKLIELPPKEKNSTTTCSDSQTEAIPQFRTATAELLESGAQTVQAQEEQAKQNTGAQQIRNRDLSSSSSTQTIAPSYLDTQSQSQTTEKIPQLPTLFALVQTQSQVSNLEVQAVCSKAQCNSQTEIPLCDFQVQAGSMQTDADVQTQHYQLQVQSCEVRLPEPALPILVSAQVAPEAAECLSRQDGQSQTPAKEPTFRCFNMQVCVKERVVQKTKGQKLSIAVAVDDLVSPSADPIKNKIRTKLRQKLSAISKQRKQIISIKQQCSRFSVKDLVTELRKVFSNLGTLYESKVQAVKKQAAERLKELEALKLNQLRLQRSVESRLRAAVEEACRQNDLKHERSAELRARSALEQAGKRQAERRRRLRVESVFALSLIQEQEKEVCKSFISSSAPIDQSIEASGLEASASSSQQSFVKVVTPQQRKSNSHSKNNSQTATQTHKKLPDKLQTKPRVKIERRKQAIKLQRPARGGSTKMQRQSSLNPRRSRWQDQEEGGVRLSPQEVSEQLWEEKQLTILPGEVVGLIVLMTAVVVVQSVK